MDQKTYVLLEEIGIDSLRLTYNLPKTKLEKMSCAVQLTFSNIRFNPIVVCWQPKSERGSLWSNRKKNTKT